jgi:putative Mn2+ efflux pump MntP
VLSVLAVALAMGLSNLAAATGIGIGGVDRRLRWRVGIVFGLFEALMPLLGLLLGHRLADSIGSTAALVGGALLVGVGLVSFVQARRRDEGSAPTAMSLPRLIATGAALSVDNLVVGFALGAYDVNVLSAAVVFAVVGVGMSLAGLELGRRLGRGVERWSGEVGAAVLVAVGIAIVLLAA